MPFHFVANTLSIVNEEHKESCIFFFSLMILANTCAHMDKAPALPLRLLAAVTFKSPWDLFKTNQSLPTPDFYDQSIN